jgi:hypothetical protein
MRIMYQNAIKYSIGVFIIINSSAFDPEVKAVCIQKINSLQINRFEKGEFCLKRFKLCMQKS